MLHSLPQICLGWAAFLAAVLPLVECAPAFIEDRGSCNADNLLRLLRTPTYLPEALSFCSSYLNLPASTIVVGTVTPTETRDSTALDTVFPTATALVTQFDSVELTESLTITDISTKTDWVTVKAEATTVTTLTVSAPVRRAEKTPLAQRVTETYDASRISSACACLTIPYFLSTVTATAASVTTTVTACTRTVTAPKVTITNTVLTTTTLPEVTQTVTLESTTDISLSTTVVSVVTSTSTIQASPAPSGFYLRSSNGSYWTNINRDGPISDDAKHVQILIAVQDPSTAAQFQLTPEGYLSLVKAGSAYTNDADGQESSNWVVYSIFRSDAEYVYMYTLADINSQDCSTCVARTFLEVADAQGTLWITPNTPPTAYQFMACPYYASINGTALFLGTSVYYGCTAAQVYLSLV